VIRLALVALLLGAISAQAELVLSAGTGANILEGSPFERVAAVGYQLTAENFFVRPELGMFGDYSGHGQSSLWAAPLFGVEAQSSVGPELHLAMGPGYLQNPDQVLGGHFQFSLEAGFGIVDRDVYVGVAWKHLSSGGLEMPNHGRDFVVVQLRLLSL
jgi:hypothetical protein